MEAPDVAPTANEDDDAARQSNPPEPPPAPTRVVLVRHAVTHQTGPLLSGRLPGIDLSDRGVEQAEAAATRLAALPIAAIYASPIERTTQTAQCIASHHDLDVQPLPGVIEADYGDWTGGKLVDLAKTPEWSVVQRAPSRARFPNGETILEMQMRTVAAIEDVVRRHEHQTVVVVSHADPIKAAIAHFAGMHLDLFQRLHVSPASVTVLDFHAHGASLVKCNDTGGLDDLLPAPEAPVPPEAGAGAEADAEAEAGTHDG
jgi:probable phosphoglycerate mutase